MYLILKRLIDVFVAGAAFLIFLPIFIPVVIVLKLTGEGEVFYLQDRIGFKNKTFKIWKFATMLKNSPNLGTGDVTVKNDPRVLPAGNFLRKTKINELPQVINVLIGNMSIVGARPLMEQSFKQYVKEVKEVIYSTPPGITGIGSLVFRDEESIIDNSDMPPREFYEKFIIPYKGQLEMWYQTHKSLYTDILIIILTAWVIISPKSKLPFKVFKDLPPKPERLVV